MMANRLNAGLHPELEATRSEYLKLRMSFIINRLEPHQRAGRVKAGVALQQLYEMLQGYAMTEVLFLNRKSAQFNEAIQGFIQIILNGIVA